MTKYYSNKSDFSGQSTAVYSGTTGTGYYGGTTSNSNPGTKVTNMLDDISTVTAKVQSEGVSHLYHQTGDAALGTEKSSSTFTNAVDRSQTLLAAAKRIHREIMQNIDSKFVKGLDEAYTSLNDVNGSEATYQTSTMTYGVTKTYQSGYSTAYGSQTKTITVQEHYTLAEILGADSPILAAQDIYTQRLAAIKEMLKTGDNLTAKQIKELKGKSDQELMEAFYPTLQSDYEKIKGSSFQEDHKEVLQYLEIGLTVVASVVAIVATAGTATPAVAAAATAANTYLIGSTAYSVATGETLITGTKLSTEERLWAAADLVATGLSAGSAKVLDLAEAGRLSTKAADVVEGGNSLLKVTKHADDVMDAINIGKDVVTGDVQSLVMDAGMAGLSAGLKVRNHTSDTTTVRTSDVSTAEHTPEQTSSKARVEDLDVPKAKHVTESGETAAGQVASTKAQAEPLAETVAAGGSGKASQVRSVDVNKAELGNVKSEVVTGKIEETSEKPPYQSFEEQMSPEDARRYRQWNKYAEAGIAPADRVKLMDWKYAPTPEFYLKNKNVYDNPDYFNQLDGSVVYPGTPESALGRVDGSVHKDGFLNGEYEEVNLTPGTVIDRYGSNGSGRYFSPEGSSFESRALPPFMQNEPYTKYVVLKEIPARSGTIAPWFDEPGMGIQYFTPDMDVNYLIDNKYIKVIK